MRLKNFIIRIIAVLTSAGVMLCVLAAPSFAQTDEEYKISGYDVTVYLNSDGSANITEAIGFTFYDGFNNIMIPISKNPGEEIEINRVYLIRKNEFINCKRLYAGQWDAEVFTGTYSVLDEGDMLKIKIYGSFHRTFGSVIIQYRVKNAVRRFQDVAEYRRMHILDSWETRISNINIFIHIPANCDPSGISKWLHGVFVGRISYSGNRTVIYNVPDTVPGEYVEPRILFPQELVENLPVTEGRPFLEQAVQEEAEYDKSDKTELLAARENAARRAGQKAYYDRLRQRAKNIFSTISVILCCAALYYFLLMQRKLHSGKKLSIPDNFTGIDRMDPAEVRMLMANGGTGARALMGKLFELASAGYVRIELRKGIDNKARIIFRIDANADISALGSADRYLLGWISGLAHPSMEFDPITLLGQTDSEERAAGLKRSFDGWVTRVKKIYAQRDILDVGIIKYRNAGIIGGALLLFLGFFIPITLSIAMGYAMIPAGVFILVYSLRIRKHTEFGVYQHKIWKSMRSLMIRNRLSAELIPEWMRPYEAYLGYSLAIGTEKVASQAIAGMIASHGEDCECVMCSMLRREEAFKVVDLYGAVRNTLAIFDQAISSVQDAA